VPTHRCDTLGRYSSGAGFADRGDARRRPDAAADDPVGGGRGGDRVYGTAATFSIQQTASHSYRTRGADARAVHRVVRRQPREPRPAITTAWVTHTVVRQTDCRSAYN
jgi:hypothetical protein